MQARLLGFGAAVLILLAIAGGAFMLTGDGQESTADLGLPVPPFPPRIAEGEAYEHCLAMLANDPAGASALAENWLASGGGSGAAHCGALAQVALGRPEAGAAQLEALARDSTAPDLARASLLGQAAQARMMAGEPDQALAAASTALALAPDDADLLMGRATAEAALDRPRAAILDLNQALAVDPHRVDALVQRAAAWRRLNRLDLAVADITRAVELDPEEPEALLERGILRQRQGDRAGARADWQKARGIDPNSVTADLADQNLALLEVGPDRR
jgi:tetratricopeptide (TPR) repeat protein